MAFIALRDPQATFIRSIFLFLSIFPLTLGRKHSVMDYSVFEQLHRILSVMRAHIMINIIRKDS